MVDPQLIKLSARNARIQVGKGGLNLPIAGENVTVVAEKSFSSKSDFHCAAKFVPMPE